MRRKEELTFLIHSTQYIHYVHTMNTIVVFLTVYSLVCNCISQNLPILSTPKPFGWQIKGPPPRTFSGSPMETLGSSSNHHHRIVRHHDPPHPRNIQDIIKSIRKPTELLQESKGVANYVKGSIDQGLLHYYKPEDPSEINLMAPKGYRFSPPVWKNFAHEDKRVKQVVLNRANKRQKVRLTRFPKRQEDKKIIPGGVIRNGDIEVIKADTIVL